MYGTARARSRKANIRSDGSLAMSLADTDFSAGYLAVLRCPAVGAGRRGEEAQELESECLSLGCRLRDDPNLSTERSDRRHSAFGTGIETTPQLSPLVALKSANSQGPITIIAAFWSWNCWAMFVLPGSPPQSGHAAVLGELRVERECRDANQRC